MTTAEINFRDFLSVEQGTPEILENIIYFLKTTVAEPFIWILMMFFLLMASIQSALNMLVHTMFLTSNPFK